MVHPSAAVIVGPSRHRAADYTRNKQELRPQRSLKPQPPPAESLSSTKKDYIVPAKETGTVNKSTRFFPQFCMSPLINMFDYDINWYLESLTRFSRFQGYVPKKNRIHYSGPLVPAGGNIEDMLKEHERQIQQAVRKARFDKARSRTNRQYNDWSFKERVLILYNSISAASGGTILINHPNTVCGP